MCQTQTFFFSYVGEYDYLYKSVEQLHSLAQVMENLMLLDFYYQQTSG